MFHNQRRPRLDVGIDRKRHFVVPGRSPQREAVSGEHALQDLLRALREERGFAADN